MEAVRVLALILLIIFMTAQKSEASIISRGSSSLITIGRSGNSGITVIGMDNKVSEKPKDGIVKIYDLPQYVGQKVKIQGEYLGWESKYGSPPVTRSDWLMHDDTAAIYITGASWDKSPLITLEGYVRMNNKGVYLEVEKKTRGR